MSGYRGYHSPRGGYHSPRGGYYHGGYGIGGFGTGLALGALTGAALSPSYGYGYGAPYGYVAPVYAPPPVIIPTTASNAVQLAAANPSYAVEFIPANQNVYTSPRIIQPSVVSSPIYYR